MTATKRKGHRATRKHIIKRTINVFAQTVKAGAR